jgi:tektin-2
LSNFFVNYGFNLLQTEEEIAELENDIRGIEEKIRAKDPPMKLAQTRLENRTYRPNVELCRDAPQ